MSRLFKFEFRRLLKSTYAYVCLVFFLVFTVVTVVATKYGISAMDSINPEEIVTLNKLVLSAIVPALSYPLFFIMLCIFVCIHYCADNGKNGIMKNVYAKGYTRESVFFVKYIVSLVYIIVVTLLCYILAFAVGAIMLGGVHGFSAAALLPILMQIVIVISMHALTYAIISKTGRMGGGLTLNLLIQIFAPSILVILQSFIGYRLNTSFNFLYLFPTAVLTFLTSTSLSTAIYIAWGVSCAACLILFLPIGFMSMRKREY